MADAAEDGSLKTVGGKRTRGDDGGADGGDGGGAGGGAGDGAGKHQCWPAPRAGNLHGNVPAELVTKALVVGGKYAQANDDLRNMRELSDARKYLSDMTAHLMDEQKTFYAAKAKDSSKISVQKGLNLIDAYEKVLQAHKEATVALADVTADDLQRQTYELAHWMCHACGRRFEHAKTDQSVLLPCRHQNVCETCAEKLTQDKHGMCPWDGCNSLVTDSLHPKSCSLRVSVSMAETDVGSMDPETSGLSWEKGHKDSYEKK